MSRLTIVESGNEVPPQTKASPSITVSLRAHADGMQLLPALIALLSQSLGAGMELDPTDAARA